MPQSVLDAYQQTAHNCGHFDQVIVFSHIEKSEKNLSFLLKATQVNPLPVDLVVVTERRTGWGSKAAVLQALLGDRDLARAVLLDDNLEVCSEIQRVCGTPLDIKLNEGSAGLAAQLGTLVIIFSLSKSSCVSDFTNPCLFQRAFHSVSCLAALRHGSSICV